MNKIRLFLDARQKTELMVQRYNAMDQFYEQYCDRLLKNFEALHKNKNDLAKLRETLPRIEDRYNTVQIFDDNNFNSILIFRSSAWSKIEFTLQHKKRMTRQKS